VVLTQKELDEELRNLVWLNSQTVFEINNSYPNLRMCLQKKKKSLKDESFPALDTNCLELFEKEQNNSGVVAINSDGKYRLVKKESFMEKLKQQKNLRKDLVSLKKSVKEQLILCNEINKKG